jgi:hypothetical protein
LRPAHFMRRAIRLCGAIDQPHVVFCFVSPESFG